MPESRATMRSAASSPLIRGIQISRTTRSGRSDWTRSRTSLPSREQYPVAFLFEFLSQELAYVRAVVGDENLGHGPPGRKGNSVE